MVSECVRGHLIIYTKLFRNFIIWSSLCLCKFLVRLQQDPILMYHVELNQCSNIFVLISHELKVLIYRFFCQTLKPQVIGAVWYLFAVDRQGKCWHSSCIGCHNQSVYCKDKLHGRHYEFNSSYCNLVDPGEITNATVFNFGLYYDALQSEVVQSTDFFRKLFYCFWWGLRNLR